MATYAEFLKKQKEYNDRDDAATAKIVSSVENLKGDVTSLKDTIAKLQASQGQVTPEDQALIDQIQARANAASEKLEGVATSLSALDDQTPPEVPTAPPPPAGPNP